MPLDNTLSDFLPSGVRIGGFTNFVTNTKPTASAIGDRWYKPAEGSEWAWNGSYWLSTQIVNLGSDYREASFSASANVWGTAFTGRDLSSGNRSGLYFLNVANAIYLQGATDGNNYWTVDFKAIYSDGTVEDLASNSAAFKPAAQWLELRSIINSPKSSLTKNCILVYASLNKLNAPSSIYCMSSLSCRYIHP